MLRKPTKWSKTEKRAQTVYNPSGTKSVKRVVYIKGSKYRAKIDNRWAKVKEVGSRGIYRGDRYISKAVK